MVHPVQELPDAQVVVIGAGFAGVVCARELRRAGCSVAVIEGRDRIGGRTFRKSRLGRDLELGGAWVHWMQPHVWAELSRYGFGVYDSAQPAQALWTVDGHTERGTQADLTGVLDPAMRAVAEQSREVYPFPHDVNGQPSPALRDADRISIAAGLAKLDVSAQSRQAAAGIWQLNASGSLDAVAMSQALRWVAAAGYDWELSEEVAGRCMIEGGTAALIDAIADDTDVAIRFGARAVAIDHTPGAATVHLDDGSAIRAGAVVVAVPLNTLGAIQFTPGLPEPLVTASAAGQGYTGSKVWFRARCESDVAPFVALTPGDDEVTALYWHYPDPDGFIGLAFTPNGRVFPPTERDGIQQALQRVVPDATVTDVAGHDWLADPFSRGTWAMLRPGQLAQVAAAHVPHGGCVVAGGDYAKGGWAGFIDGAVEDGYRAVRQVLAMS